MSHPTCKCYYFIFFIVVNIVNKGILAKPPKPLLGGTDTPIGDIPSQVSFRLNNNHHCGGTLVSTKHVLIAAHCVYDLVASYKQLKVVTGTNSLINGGESHGIDDITVHWNFTMGPQESWHNDIALITLDNDIEVNTYQSPISLPEEDTPADVIAVVSGWGYKDYKDFPEGEYSTILQKSEMKILTNDKCRRAYKIEIKHEHICGFKGGFSGICKGDGGSPLLYNDSVVGIASWYFPCALGLPDIYTRVYHYHDWILDVMSQSFYLD